MANCEMCGKESYLVLIDIEGGELKVCSNCTKYGTIKKKIGSSSKLPFKHKSTTKEPVEFKVVNEYASLIRIAREKRGMKQEDFAKLLNERESIVAKWEQGTLKPRIEVARRVGRVLKINLVENEEGDVSSLIEKKQNSSGEPTLGDFVKVRKRN